MMSSQQTETCYVYAAKYYSQVLRDWLWVTVECSFHPHDKLPFYHARDALILRDGTRWRIATAPFNPPDNHHCYDAKALIELSRANVAH
jgi:hypothetical protein